MRFLVLMCALALLGACRLGFESLSADESVGDAAAGISTDSAADLAVLDGPAGSPDASVLDSSPPAAPDHCPDVDENTLALYTFDGDTDTQISDAVGNHHGLLHNAAMPPLVMGPDGCGQALSFPGDVHVEVGDAPAWQLSSGSVDLWVRPVAGLALPYAGIVSRDANGATMPGHMTLIQWIDPALIVVKMQQPGDGGGGMFLCSDAPVVFERWTHVGINFGPPGAELWIDGERASANTVIQNPFSGPVTCNAADARSIDGNFNPWAFGGDTGASGEGSMAMSRPFINGAIDHVRISDIQRDFSMIAIP